MKRKQFFLVPTTFINEDREEWKYTVIYTDFWEVQVFKTLEETIKDINECKKEWKFFRTKKLDEYSATLEHYWEFVIDLTQTKILWYKEHTIIDDFKKQRELTEEKKLETNK